MKESNEYIDFNESVIIIKDGIAYVPEEKEKEEKKEYTYKSITLFYERVRTSLNVGITSISNDMIDFFEYAPMAEIKIKGMVPKWEELDELKTQMFYTCIVYQTCAALCPVASSRQEIEQTTPSLTLKFASPKNDKPCEMFYAKIDELLSEILEDEFEQSTRFMVSEPTFGFVNKR